MLIQGRSHHARVKKFRKFIIGMKKNTKKIPERKNKIKHPGNQAPNKV